MRSYGGELKYKGKWYDNCYLESVEVAIYPKGGLQYDIAVPVPKEINKSVKERDEYIEWWTRKFLNGKLLWVFPDVFTEGEPEYSVEFDEEEK